MSSNHSRPKSSKPGPRKNTKITGDGSEAAFFILGKHRLILEMKRGTEDLRDHYEQAFEYWLHSVPHRLQYVVLCNFGEFWMYEFEEQMEEPMDRVRRAAPPFGFEGWALDGTRDR